MAFLSICSSHFSIMSKWNILSSIFLAQMLTCNLLALANLVYVFFYYFTVLICLTWLHLVLWHCWLGVRKGLWHETDLTPVSAKFLQHFKTRRILGLTRDDHRMIGSLAKQWVCECVSLSSGSAHMVVSHLPLWVLITDCFAIQRAMNGLKNSPSDGDKYKSFWMVQFINDMYVDSRYKKAICQ